MRKINKQRNFSINYTKKSIQENVIDKSEYGSLCKIFTKSVDETKNESFSLT